MPIYEGINNVFELFKLILIIRILLTWFPNIDWWKQPFKFFREASDPFLDIFRKIIPPIGGLDLSPIVAFLALNFLQVIVLSLLSAAI